MSETKHNVERPNSEDEKYYIMLFSIHGLVRSGHLELGRDADTGGQIKYVVELAKYLIKHPNVEKVDLVTRRVVDSKVDDIYAEDIEEIEPGANIVRISCGPRRYLAKESLWPHLEMFVDNTLNYMRSIGRAPDLVHGHYADAGYVASRLSSLLDIPMVFTGHSLGRVKKQRLLDKGSKPETIEKRYKISRRIEAEETALDHASFVVASTSQEVQEQYSVYDNYTPKRMSVIPPAVDLESFSPPPDPWEDKPPFYDELRRFLKEPEKPMILAISRPDPRKNIPTLVKAYGENKELREKANLAIIAGTRDDIRQMEKNTRKVLYEILTLMDYYDLYGQMAIPKYHEAHEVPHIYQIAASTEGVFVNPALTEPFGLTMLEAAASGLPVVATNDGGPQDIIGYCENGVLIDPLNQEEMSNALLKAASDKQQWKQWSENGIKGTKEHFSWPAHVEKYVRLAKSAIYESGRYRKFYSPRSRLVSADRVVVSDIDNTLIGDKDGLEQLLQRLKDAGAKVAFGVATGRSIELTKEVLQEWDIPMPQLLITSVGSAIHYGPHLVEDKGWENHISYRWKRDALVEAMKELPGITLQPPAGQKKFKISYNVEPEKMPSVDEIYRHLRRSQLQAKVIYSHGAYLDLLPIRASKGMALRYFCMRWGIPLQHCLVAGDSGNDEEMLSGNTLGVVVGNYDKELESLRENPTVYFAQGHYARGIVEGIEHYDLFGEIKIPDTEMTTA
jgi:sucrose-phosphate synthase